MFFIALLCIAIFQGVVLGIVILKSPLFNTSNNKYLAFFIFVLSLLLLNLALDLAGAYLHYPVLRFLDDIETTFLLPVFLLLFVVHKGTHPLKSSKKLYLLFIPFGYSLLLNLYIDLSDVSGFYKIPTSLNPLIAILSSIELFSTVLFFPFVLLATYALLKHIKEDYTRAWLTKLWFLVATILFSWVIGVLLVVLLGFDISEFLKFLALVSSFLIHWVTYIGLYRFRLSKDYSQLEVLIKKNSVKETNENTVASIEKFGADNLYFKKMESLFKQERIFTDPNLDRRKTADKLGISPGYLSQIVNSVSGQSFTQYLNKHRVDAVKDMIRNPEFKKYSLLTIGLESGFTSKTTFYKAFKKHTGLTPSQYRERTK